MAAHYQRQLVQLALILCALALVLAARSTSFSTFGSRLGSYVSPRPLPSGASVAISASESAPPTGCAVPDRGPGDYVETERALGARVFVRPPAIKDDGTFGLVLHFHGGEPMRRLLAPEGLPVVLATIDRGVGSSAYAEAIDEQSLAQLQNLIAQRVSSIVGFPTTASTLFLSSWSAGYKAIEGVLAKDAAAKQVDAVVLLDSLHASFDGPSRTLSAAALQPFVNAGLRAIGERSFFFALIHTEIRTADYASTTETADVVLGALGVVPEAVDDDATSFSRFRFAEKSGVVVHGYRGGDEAAHCNVLYLGPSLIRRGLAHVDSRAR